MQRICDRMFNGRVHRGELFVLLELVSAKAAVGVQDAEHAQQWCDTRFIRRQWIVAPIGEPADPIGCPIRSRKAVIRGAKATTEAWTEEGEPHIGLVGAKAAVRVQYADTGAYSQVFRDKRLGQVS